MSADGWGDWGSYAGEVCCHDCGKWLAVTSAFYWKKEPGRFFCLYCARRRGRPER